ncbi:NUDIX domain-containing protein [Nocardioides sp. zg-579]|uniref:NUDIX domain-containing protein n=1 Tax=Nocardioides marmotae TaxID=2663857 RepID=A0A6I3JCI6_9ACTN|nr:NUDIX hydrolase [Nocardioides marmotae]MCR6032155.1 NUDIX domain-containing protein [Gordonia jinghuaiqii]MTB95801.1 NUDIX domain-containing protein [Nocardioides marmotae]QKE02843.1 NUDIX hydrolase [Nocardioides marmotae]
MDVESAGAVVLGRDAEGTRAVLLVHRPKYDDWSFPKGKLDPGEHRTTAAVREVAEETGLAVRLGPPLAPQRYPVAGGRMKTVHYWVGRVLDSSSASLVEGYTYGTEIDRVAWVPLAEAPARLSYPHDAETLAEARALPRGTAPLVVLRHGQAHPRKQWREDDRLRPLAPAGRAEALALVPVLAAYGVSAVVTSPSTRCVETVLPFAGAAGLTLREEPALSEEDATPRAVRRVVADLLDRRAPTLLCTHRPVLPHVLAALGLPDPSLDPAAFLVAHHRRGVLVASEVLAPPS